ncbi:MAG TPA: tryptophan--tRNA ligase [Chloroflexota bacterium]|nr:tryptophan--tRNA ligase [Chloroflexota bacterium]
MSEPRKNGAVPKKKRLLTGLRPTGKFHLGNYVGTFEKDLELQNSGEFECFFLIADYHTLTTGYETAGAIGNDIREGALDFLAVGIDPSKSTLYLQSLIPEVSELFLLFTMLVSATRAQRIPTLKEQIRDLKLDSASLGLLNYPVLQAADILMVRGEVVPVGKDQMSHIELTREVARRFNQLYSPVFPEPEYLEARFPVLPGTDGKPKMSKSIGNTIMLSDDAETVRKKVMAMYTDPTRLRATDPGHVKGNPVFVYHDAFNLDAAEVADLKARYTKGTVGDVEVKKKLIVALNTFLDPIRDRRAEYERQPGLLEDILAEGSRRARAEAKETLELAREAMGLNYFPRARARVQEATGVGSDSTGATGGGKAD